MCVCVQMNDPDLADTLNRFLVPDFVVCTQQGRLVAVDSSSFDDYDINNRRGMHILDGMITDTASVHCHPAQPEFAAWGRDGTLQRWDMISRSCLAVRSFPKAAGAKVAYSRDGSFLVVGMQTGHLHILNVQDLSDVHGARNTPHVITHLATATTGRHVAVADSEHQVLLYAYMPYKHIMRWEFVGKARPHHGKVAGLVFGESPSGQTRLFSIGEDKRFVEYHLAASSPSAGLVVAAYKDLSMANTPTSLTFAPPLLYYKHHSARTLLLIAGMRSNYYE